MTRKEVRDIIRQNLADAGVTFYSDDDINDVIQDAYNEIAAKTQCILKSSTISWVNKRNYWDFRAALVTDYLGCIGIFNNNNNWWLRDDVSLRDFDRLRRDWEIWNGQPQFWTPHSVQYIAVAPRMTTAVGTFLLWYYASAPALSSDSSTFLIAEDMQDMLENYGTADLLESASEPTKASTFWKTYYEHREEYKVRVKSLAKAELLLRV